MYQFNPGSFDPSDDGTVQFEVISSNRDIGKPLEELERPSLSLYHTAGQVPEFVHTQLSIFKRDSVLYKTIDHYLRGTRGLTVLSGASSSQGNMTIYVSSDVDGTGEALIVDCGLKGGKIREALNTLGLRVESGVIREVEPEALAEEMMSFPVRNMFLTHLHSDHFSEEAARFCSKFRITVHIESKALEDLKAEQKSEFAKRILHSIELLESQGLVQVFTIGQVLNLGDFRLIPERAVHDSVATSFSVEAHSLLAFHSGDTGTYTPSMKSALTKAHVWIGDGNYDPERIARSPYPAAVRDRTEGPTGHMGNHQNRELFRFLSEGVNSHNLQVAVMAHRSSTNNLTDPEAQIKDIKSVWNRDRAGRHAPAILIADKGPQFLCTLLETREVVIPTRSDPVEVIKVSFGETGLSIRAGRDVMPEILEGVGEKADELNNRYNSQDLDSVRERISGRIYWREPNQTALVFSGNIEQFKNLAQLVFCYQKSRSKFVIHVDPALLYPDEEEKLSAVACILNRHLKKSSGIKLERFKVIGNSIYSTVPIYEHEINDLIAISEIEVFGSSARERGEYQATKVHWPVPNVCALIFSDDVYFSRSVLAPITVFYNQDRKKLLIETHRGFDGIDPKERMNKLYEVLQHEAYLDQGGNPITWEHVGSTISHRSKINMKGSELNALGELVKKVLVWGEDV